MVDVFQEKLLTILGIIAREFHESNRLKREEIALAKESLSKFEDEQAKLGEELDDTQFQNVKIHDALVELNKPIGEGRETV